MQFSVLGPMTVAGADGRTVTPAPRLRQLLALLLLARGDAVPVTALAADLWPAGAPATVRTTLRTYVHDLRRLLPGGDRALRTTDAGYRLRVPAAAVDAFVFHSLLARARALLDGAPPPDLDRPPSAPRPDTDRLREADRLLRRGLALWRGPALAGVPAGPTLELHIAALQAEWRQAVRLRVHLDLLLGRHHDLIGELKDLVSEFPLDEEFHAQLMVALHRCGRRGEALQVYGRHRRTLRAELGADVPPRLRRLCHRILAAEAPAGGAPTPAPAPPTAPTAAGRRPPPPARHAPRPGGGTDRHRPTGR